MNTRKQYSILCIHQGSELYGSDIMFIQSVQALRQFFPAARIDVVIPGHGPIEPLIRQYSDNVLYGPILVLRKSNIKTVSGIKELFLLPASIIQALRMMKNYQLIYINTIVIVNFLIASLFSSRTRLLHIHEIISGLPGKLAGLIAQKASTAIICNSQATAKAFGLTGRSNVHVIWNGTDCPGQFLLPDSNHTRPLNVLMPGRINSWKGQDLLIKAVGRLDKNTRIGLKIRIVGDVYKGQDHFRKNLFDLINRYELDESVKLMGFCSDMKTMYEWADLVIVPSLKPEPFGLVAIEAMSHARPVIASAHGGLNEIILDNVTGWLVPPGDADAMADLLKSLIQRKDDIQKKGFQARKRALLFFSNSGYRKNIGTLAVSFLGRQ